MITLNEEHEKAIDNLKERPSGLNFSQWVRKTLEKEFPGQFDNK